MLCISFARFSTTARNIKHIQRLILKLSLYSQQVTPWNPLDFKGQNPPWLYTFRHCEMEKDRWSQGNSAHLALPFCLGGNTFYEGLATAEEPLSGILGLKDRALVSRVSGDANACSFPMDSWRCRGMKDICHHWFPWRLQLLSK